MKNIKRISAAVLCGATLLCFASCNSFDDETIASDTVDGTEYSNIKDEEAEADTGFDQSEADESNYAFISSDERESWRDDLIAILSHVEIKDFEEGLPGSFAVGLMDFNFDNAPEVVVAWAGGSMGNVFLEVYDLRSHEEIGSNNSPHYVDWDGVYYCVHDKNGEKMIINEGSIRVEPTIGFIKHIRQVNGLSDNESAALSFTPLFSETVSADPAEYTYCGEKVGKEEYDEHMGRFKADCKKIASTQIQLIKWDTVITDSREETVEKMADALIGSSQKFIDNLVA